MSWIWLKKSARKEAIIIYANNEIMDVKDYPVLYTAIMENVDILITGDKDFLGIDIEKPEIMTPKNFTEKYL